MIEKEYNLLDERWIRVLDADGGLAELSLPELFARAHLCKRLANETETVDAVILRLLLAILYAVFSDVDADNKDVPLTNDNAIPRWKSLWEKNAFPCAPIEACLEHFRERFWLFHPETPFYQTADLESRKCTEYHAPKLIGDISQSGNKGRLFFARTDSGRLENAEAARWLLHLNAFDDTSAKPSIRGGDMKSPGAGWLGKLGIVLSEGQNLFQTLLLNFVLLDVAGKVYDRGKPVWEAPVRSGERKEIAQPSSLAELYTLQSRRLLLTREGGAVVGYKLLGGDFFEKENAFVEPMTLWRRNSKTGNFTPMRHNPARQIWRDFSALIATEADGRPPGIVQWNKRLINKGILSGMQLRFSAPSVGYGDKDFFADDLFSDSVSINAYLLSDLGDDWQIQIVENLKKTDEAVQAFGRFASDLALAAGADDDKSNIARIRNAAREAAYSALDIPFRAWLADLRGDENVNEAMINWKQSVRSILIDLAEERLNNAEDAAFIGRKGYSASKAELYFKGNLKTALFPKTT
jgi:CRISPR system Cascade subunit CasA